MHIEIEQQREIEPTYRFDAVLVHSYGFRQAEHPKIKPSLRGHIQVTACGELVKAGLVRNIVIAGGKIWGKSYPSLSSVMAQDLQNQFGIGKEQLFLSEDAFSTNGEIEVFLGKQKKWAGENFWSWPIKPICRELKDYLKVGVLSQKLWQQKPS